jgi:HEAT repeat protein
MLCGCLSAGALLWAQDAAGSTEAARLDTIRYGTDAEIVALIQNLKTEGADYLDDELIALSLDTRNEKIVSGVFAFFGEREKSGLEDRAVRAVEERDDVTSETVLAAVDYLGKVKAEQAAPVLRGLLDSGERRFMNAAFRALGRVGEGGTEADDIAEYLIDYYTNRDPGDDNRRDVITAIGAAGSRQGVSFLAEIAVNSEERIPLRIAAVESLAKIGDPDGLDAILDCISTKDPNVRAAAVAALGPFSGAAVDQAILEAFRDSYYRTRLAAAQASRQRKLAAAIPYLQYRAEHDDVPAVKNEAIRALGAIAGAQSTATLEGLFTERKNADPVRLAAAEMLMQNEPAQYLDRCIAEMDEAKQKNQTALYNGFLKIIGGAKTGNMETITRRLLRDKGVIEKSYALDMAANNNLRSLAEDIKTLARDTNPAISRKARGALEKLGVEL